jgi:hypothetical protein
MHNLPELESLMTDGMASQGISIIVSPMIADKLAHCMAIENSVGFVEWMQEKKRIDSDTADTLIKMLRSQDVDNFNIAILAIEQLKK